jgi:hypothetical protein
MPKIGKLEQKAIDIAKAHVIETKTHSYCPAIYKYLPDGKFVVAMATPGGLPDSHAAHVINVYSEVQPIWAKTKNTLVDADASLIRLAHRSDDFEKIYSGFELYDMRLADQGKPPQNPRQTQEVTPQPIARQEQNETVVSFSLNFESLAAHANYRYEILTKPSRAQSRALVELGFIILIAKRELPHGELTRWINQNTRVTEQWARYARRSAEQFIDEHGEQSLLLLCNPTAEADQTERVMAEQQMMDFTGGKGPSALLHDLGIKKRPTPDKAEPLPPEERERQLAEADWTELINRIAEHDQDWMLLTDDQIAAIDQIVWPIASAIHKSTKNH